MTVRTSGRLVADRLVRAARDPRAASQALRRRAAARLVPDEATATTGPRPAGASVAEPLAGQPQAVAEAVDVILDRIHAVIGAPCTEPMMVGTCNVCGSHTAFVWRGRLPFRESLSCVECLSTSRYRSLARGLLWSIRELAGIDAPSLADLPRSGPPLRVYDTQLAFYYPPFGAYAVPDLLEATGWIEVHSSRFDPADPWGRSYGPRMTNQTLEALTFDDGAFDVLVTSDVMEHVRLDERAHREIHRVLRPGGHYVFTVPHTRQVAQTVVRVLVHDADDPDSDEFVLEPEYHGSADAGEGGVLAYRLYGTDIDEQLRSIGFAVDYWSDAVPHNAILDTELFVCQKAREA